MGGFCIMGIWALHDFKSIEKLNAWLLLVVKILSHAIYNEFILVNKVGLSCILSWSIAMMIIICWTVWWQHFPQRTEAMLFPYNIPKQTECVLSWLWFKSCYLYSRVVSQLPAFTIEPPIHLYLLIVHFCVMVLCFA